MFLPHSAMSAVVAPDDIDFYKGKGYSLLDGPLRGILKQGAYLVVGPATIEKNDVLVIESGALLMVMRECPLTVAGRLDVRGGQRGTVTFTVLQRDRYHRPLADTAPNLWQGIRAVDSAHIDLRYAIISGAECGVEIISAAAEVMCDYVNFRGNMTNVKVGEYTVPAPEGKFYSVTLSGGDQVATWSSVEDARNRMAVDSAKALLPQVVRKPEKRRAVRLTLGITGGVCALAGATGFIVHTVYFDKYSSASDPSKTTPADLSNWRRNAKTGKVVGIAGGIGVVLALTGFTLTFFF